jgi:hypothetical protein
MANVEKEGLSLLSSKEFFGVLIQYPDTYGALNDWTSFTSFAHEQNTLVIGATDLLASTLFKPVGEMGIDIAIGSTQRFGVPMGFGGPHAAFLATTEAYRSVIYIILVSFIYRSISYSSIIISHLILIPTSVFLFNDIVVKWQVVLLAFRLMLKANQL